MAIVDYQRRMNHALIAFRVYLMIYHPKELCGKPLGLYKDLPSLIDLEPFIALRKKKTFAYDIQMNKHNCNQRIKKEQEN